MGCWCGYLSGARCRLAYGPADATATHCLLLQIGFTFLVPAHLGSPRQRAVKRVCVCLTVMLCEHGTILVLSEKCNLEQCNFCATLTNLQISTIFAVACNFCATSYAYVQFGRALLRPPIIFDRLSMPKIDCLTGKLQSLMCLQPNSVETNSCYSSWSFLIKLAL